MHRVMKPVMVKRSLGPGWAVLPLRVDVRTNLLTFAEAFVKGCQFPCTVTYFPNSAGQRGPGGGDGTKPGVRKARTGEQHPPGTQQGSTHEGHC